MADGNSDRPASTDSGPIKTQTVAGTTGSLHLNLRPPGPGPGRPPDHGDPASQTNSDRHGHGTSGDLSEHKLPVKAQLGGRPAAVPGPGPAAPTAARDHSDSDASPLLPVKPRPEPGLGRLRDGGGGLGPGPRTSGHSSLDGQDGEERAPLFDHLDA